MNSLLDLLLPWRCYHRFEDREKNPHLDEDCGFALVCTKRDCGVIIMNPEEHNE